LLVDPPPGPAARPYGERAFAIQEARRAWAGGGAQSVDRSASLAWRW